MRIALMLTTLLIGWSASAAACSVGGPSTEELASAVASDGVLVRATVLQAFDAALERPEIIRAEAIYVGQGEPRDFVIYRSREFFALVRQQAGKQVVCDIDPRLTEVGQVYERLVLMPAESIADPAANGRWQLDRFGGNIVQQKGLDLLIGKARSAGRFQSRPPRAVKWGDCCNDETPITSPPP